MAGKMISEITYSEDIKRSSLKTTGKGILAELVKLIDQYNGKLVFCRGRKVSDRNFLIPPHMVDLIDKTCLCCMAYLLFRAPQVRKESGQRKWNDVLRIQQQLMQHADFFGIRLLRGDFSGTSGDANYWLERHIPQTSSFGGQDDVTSGTLTCRGPANSKLDGYAFWLDKKNNDQRDDFLTYASLAPAALQYFNDATRQSLAVELRGNKVKLAAAPEDYFLDTPGLGATGTYSGLDNVIIYVACPRTLKLYTWTPEDNVVHHSSFLQGAPVMAAGDWLVENGMVKFINAGSGHYQPTVENMRMFATMFKNYWNSETLIQPAYEGHIYKIGDFINNGAQAVLAPKTMIEALKSKLGSSFKYKTETAKKSSALPSWPPAART